MCGILGIYGEYKISEEGFLHALKLQYNRGPDNISAIPLNDSFLGHARLSIQDLSASANQPMFSLDGRYSLIFNGEIYNYDLLKERLHNPNEIATQSDTEVLLRYLIEFGVKATLSHAHGMFAFAFCDHIKGEVFVCRDPFGEKPLYYCLNNNNITVSSSLYSLVDLYGTCDIDTSALSTYLHYGYTKGKDSILENYKKIEPGTFLHYSIDEQRVLSISGYNNTPIFNEDSCSINNIIRESVNSCLKSDVPVGIFLSGGVDSSLIASYVSEVDRNIEAFTIGFENKGYDESQVAEEVARFLGLKINKLILSKDDLYSALNETSTIFDEPFADASYLALYKLSQYAKDKVTVCLSGDGGDELYTGYNRHVLADKIYRKLKPVPRFIRCSVSTLLCSSDAVRNKLLPLFYKCLYGKELPTAFFEKVDKLSEVITFRDKNDLLFKILSGRDYSKVLDIPEPFKPDVQDLSPRTLSTYDRHSYLHENVLVKVDRTTMACSMEARAPLLNSNVFNFALSDKDEEHISNGEQKVALRKLVRGILPSDILNMPKSGFSVPYQELLDTKMKSDFKKYMDSLSGLDFFDENIFNKLNNCIELYYKGSFKDYKLIWNIFFLYRWLHNVNLQSNELTS
ncbi:asparagine synthase (glutamine-hydrolyzing) [Vibrio sp. Isolate22]|uniref:asparagine synthase (glutamine-hydrolyzing) n=1 Tax=Vibrio sp. Isolate22 TaxID=2908532 RepID=UPI001EFCB9EB|nr:asparagine synthase (glutamine-hydrolyzing) [Vibrio sp. Isolate22]MCG9693948.1 asparagine synthase (glutamine-hydrolyzing) [Vibrio sp. Isolate22]